MSLAKDFIGVSPVTGSSMQGTSGTYAAAGSTLATATDLTNGICNVSSGSGGVQLWAGIIGDWQVVYNTSGSSVTVYPSSSSAKINQLSAGTGVSLANNTTAVFYQFSATQHFVNLSA